MAATTATPIKNRVKVYNPYALYVTPWTSETEVGETTYKLDVTGDYADILSSSEQLLDAVHEFWRKSQLN